jgi:ubiquinone/menaquinone biosynthesis C-methylase UbiE
VSGRFSERFSRKAEAYAKYRPTYPKEIIGILNSQIKFSKDRIVADVGSGTGILSRIFLDNGNFVYGIEPNNEMRSFAEKDLTKYPKFVSLNRLAENTGLPNLSVDLVTAGQALHWFDREKARLEFFRILKPGGYVMIIYNERKKQDGMMDDYDAIVDRNASKSEAPDIDAPYLEKFFASKDYKEYTVSNEQILDFEGLVGRASSASYLPSKDDPGFDSLVKDLKKLFDSYQKNGSITLQYQTILFLGQIHGVEPS